MLPVPVMVEMLELVLLRTLYVLSAPAVAAAVVPVSVVHSIMPGFGAEAPLWAR